MKENNLPCSDECCWKQRLTPEQYYVLREGGTEAPFSGQYVNFFEDGTYRCAACGQILFSSAQKYDSGCGWPSFDDAVPGSVTYKFDNSHGVIRIETRCSNCDSHLGHVFSDGSAPTGQRYCINSAALKFQQGDE